MKKILQSFGKKDPRILWNLLFLYSNVSKPKVDFCINKKLYNPMLCIQSYVSNIYHSKTKLTMNLNLFTQALLLISISASLETSSTCLSTATGLYGHVGVVLQHEVVLIFKIQDRYRTHTVRDTAGSWHILVDVYMNHLLDNGVVGQWNLLKKENKN